LTNKPEKLKDNEYIGISAFETMKASIDFAIDNQIPRGKPTRYSTELYFFLIDENLRFSNFPLSHEEFLGQLN